MESSSNASNSVDHSQPVSSMICNLSRGLEESFGKNSGCNNSPIIEERSCSGDNDSPITEEISRGSEYQTCISGNPSPTVNEQSRCSETSVNDSLVSEETRHFISKENSSNDPVQRSTDSSSNHFASKSAISPDLIKLLSLYPKELERIQSHALWAENEWRKSAKWPLFGDI